MRSRTRARLLPLTVALALVALAGCGSDEPTSSSGGATQGFTPPEVPMQQSLGAGEGQVNLVAWAGYVEDGSTEKDVDWVTPFEKETGCQVNVKVAATSDEMVQLMKSGQYDAVSASGDASLRLIRGGDVQPMNPKLIPDFPNFIDALKSPPHNTVDGVHYGISLQWGPNTLLYNTKKVKPEQITTYAILFEQDGVRGVQMRDKGESNPLGDILNLGNEKTTTRSYKSKTPANWSLLTVTSCISIAPAREVQQ